MNFMNKTENLVSVILPTYNRASFLKPCVEKILNSNYSPLELIIVNDASTDNTFELLETYKNYNNVKIIHLSKNSGTVCIPRNIGISHSTGQYISHADDDVVTHKDKFSILVELLQKNPQAYLGYGNRKERWKNGTEKVATFTPNWNPNIGGTGVDNGQILYRSSVYEIIPFVWYYRACDYYLAKEIFNNFGPFCSVSDVISTYIWHDNNRSLTTNHLYNNLKTQEIPKHIIEPFKKYLLSKV